MKQVFRFAFGIAILSLALPAAADIKAYHGAFCQPQDWASADNVNYGAINGIVASGLAFVTCPLMRDRINSSTSLAEVALEVTSGGSEISCTLYSQAEDGSLGSWIDSDTDSRTSTGQLNYYVDSSSGNEGTYGLACAMGDGTAIYHIHVNEDGATD